MYQSRENGELGAEDVRVMKVNDIKVAKVAYESRRQLLDTLRLGTENWSILDSQVGGATALLEQAHRRRLEGVVLKRLGSHYEESTRERRSGSWLKIKIAERQEFVIGGWLTGLNSRRGRVGAPTARSRGPGPCSARTRRRWSPSTRDR